MKDGLLLLEFCSEFQLNCSWISTSPDFYMAIVSAIALVVALFEYYRSRRHRKVDIALDALKYWESNLSIYTGPAISLLRQHKANHQVYDAIKKNQPIRLRGKEHKKHSYGYLIGPRNIISARDVSEMRLALYHYLNSWELIAEAYSRKRADKRTIKAHLVDDRSYEDMQDTLGPFMESFKAAKTSQQPNATAWTPVQNLLNEFDPRVPKKPFWKIR